MCPLFFRKEEERERDREKWFVDKYLKLGSIEKSIGHFLIKGGCASVNVIEELNFELACTIIINLFKQTKQARERTL